MRMRRKKIKLIVLMVVIFNVPFVPPVAMPQLASESRLRDQGIRDKRAMIDLATVP